MMNKWLCSLLCMLAFAACSDDGNDTLFVPDDEKPFAPHSSAELRSLMQDNLDQCERQEADFRTYVEQVQDRFAEAMEHYGVDFGFVTITSDFSSPQVRSASGNSFVGMKLTWNPDKSTPGFDTTINAGAVVEVLFPSSVTDDSKNDLRMVINSTVAASEKWLESSLYHNGELQMRSSRYVSDTKSEGSVTVPPYSATMRRFRNEGSLSRFVISSISAEYLLKKEGGASHLFSVLTVGSDMEMKMEYNNIRVRGTINQIGNIYELWSLFEDMGEERANELMGELIGKNLSRAVVVFTDRDQKIGDLELEAFNGNFYDMDWACRFRDGEKFSFRFVAPGPILK